jgi:hypothetical protein
MVWFERTTAFVVEFNLADTPGHTCFINETGEVEFCSRQFAARGF